MTISILNLVFAVIATLVTLATCDLLYILHKDYGKNLARQQKISAESGESFKKFHTRLVWMNRFALLAGAVIAIYLWRRAIVFA